MGSILRVSIVSLLFWTSVSALSPHRFGCSSLTKGRIAAAAAAAAALSEKQRLQPLREGPLTEGSRGPPFSLQRVFGLAFLRAQPGLERRSQWERSRSPVCSDVHKSWTCRGSIPRDRLGPLGTLEGPPGAPETEELHEAAEFESWGHHLPIESSNIGSTEQVPSREAGAPRVPGAIDVHFGAPSDAPLGAPQAPGDRWRHLQLPIETFLFLAIDSPADALRFLKEGAPHLLGNAHVPSGGPPRGALGADVYELRLAQASFIEAAAAAIQRRAAAKSEAPKGGGALESLRKQIDGFFGALLPRVLGPPSLQPQPQQQQQRGQHQQQNKLLHKAAEIWDELRVALFTPEELPPFAHVSVIVTKGGAPLWQVRRATGLRGPHGGPPTSRKLLLRLPELALHEALLQSPPSTPGDVPSAAKTTAANTTAARGEAALRWAVLSAMVRYRELIDPEALDLTADPQGPQGPSEGPQGTSLSIRLSPSGTRRRLRLLRSLKDVFSIGDRKGGRSGGPRPRRASPLWLLPLGSAVRAWLEASPASSPEGGGAATPVQLSLSQRRQLSSWDLSSLFHVLLRCGAARDSGEAVALLEGLLLSLDMQPPDLDALEEEMRREGAQKEGLSPGPPKETDNATAGSLLALPAFIEALTLEGVDAAARVVAPLMAQLSQQAQTLASQLGLPSANVETPKGTSSTRPAKVIPRAQALERRREFLLLINAIERRMLLAVAEALEASVLGGTGLHARRLTPEPEGPGPADEEEAAVRTFVEAQVFVRDLCHTVRQALRLPEGPQEGPPSPPSQIPAEDPKASIPFPSFSDVLTPSEGNEGAPPSLKGAPVLATSHALATAAARLFAFFHFNCFGRGLPAAVQLHISRGLNSPTAVSCRFHRERQDGDIRAEWTVYIHPDIRHLPLLASSLLSSMFAIYKDAVLPPRALLPPGVPPVEGSSEETQETVSHSGSCCKAVGLWQSIRHAAERNAWPFYVGLQNGEPLQLALASSIAPPRGGPGDPAQALGSPRPLLDLLSGKASHRPSPSLSPQGSPIKTLRSAAPLAAPGSVSAALTLAAVETQVLLTAESEAEQDKILKALESCSAERYEGSGLPTPFLSRLIEMGVEPSRALSLLNALTKRHIQLPQSQQVSNLMAVSRPETAASPVVVPSPKLEEPLASIAKDWRRGAIQFLPMVHALWAGERGAAAGAAAAGALAVASDMGSDTPMGTQETAKAQPLDTWAWRVADKLGRDAVGVSFLMRWLEGHSRGDQHSTECLHSASTGIDLRGIVAGGPPAEGMGTPAGEALMREGLKYLEDLHILEHQHQHAQRLLTMQHLMRNRDNPEGLTEAVSQAFAGLAPPRVKETGVSLPPGVSAEAIKAASDEKAVAEEEAALRETLNTGGHQLLEGPERLAMAGRLYGYLNRKCFGGALSPRTEIVFEDPNVLGAAGGTLQRASFPSTVLAAHAADVGDFRLRPIIYMMQLMGRVYHPFTTLGVDTPQELQEHITASRLVPLAEQYSSRLSKAPLQPPASDGLQRVQTLATPEQPQPDDPAGFMSLSRFFQSSAAIPAILKEAGRLSGEAATAHQKLLAAAATAAAGAAAHAPKERPRPENHQALHLLAAEAAQAVIASSPNPDDLSPAGFLDALEFVQMEAARHYAREGTEDLPVAVSEPGEDGEDNEALEEQGAGMASHGKGRPQRDWRELLKPSESIRLVKHALLNKDGATGTSLLGDLVESGSASLERGIEILAEAVTPQKTGSEKNS